MSYSSGLLIVMELLDVNPNDRVCYLISDDERYYVHPRLRGEVRFNPSQEAIVRAAKPGKILIAYRADSTHVHGCTFLAEFLEQRAGWIETSDIGGRVPGIIVALESDMDVVIDMTRALSVHEKRNDVFRQIDETRTAKRVIVMYTGIPPALIKDAVLLNITDIPGVEGGQAMPD